MEKKPGSPTDPDKPAGIGQTLRTRRLQRSVTVEIVGQDTRIHPRFLRALEDEKWEEFPARVYLQGFLRQYANYLGLDGEELVRRWREQAGEAATPSVSRPGTEPASHSEEKAAGPVPGPLLAGAAVLLLLGGLYFYNKEKESAVPPPPPREAFPAGLEPVAPETPRGGHEFVLRVKGAVWVRAWVDGRVRFEGTLLPGTVKSWSGQTGLRVQSANLALLDIQVNGRPLLGSAENAPGEIAWPSEKAPSPATHDAVSPAPGAPSKPAAPVRPAVPSPAPAPAKPAATTPSPPPAPPSSQ